MVVGDASPDEMAALFDLAWGGRETLIVVSSDMSHYLGYEEARPLAAWEREAVRVFVAVCNITFLGLRAALVDEWGREALSHRLLLMHLEKARKCAATL